MRLEHAIKNVVNNQLEEGTALQVKMALSDVGIRNSTWKNNKVYVKKRDVKKAEKALEGNVIYKGKTPVVVGEEVETDEAKKSFKSFAHTLKDLVNKVDEAKISHTPGQDNMGEHPISKNTADYEEKYFTLPGGEGKDDREEMGVTGKPKEHKKDVESTEDHENPTKKTRKPPAHVAEDLESLNQQRVQELLEKYGPKQG